MPNSAIYRCLEEKNLQIMWLEPSETCDIKQFDWTCKITNLILQLILDE